MLDALLRTLGLVRKELLAILKDPRSRIALVGPPIFQCLIFGYAATYQLTTYDQTHRRHLTMLTSRCLQPKDRS